MKRSTPRKLPDPVQAAKTAIADAPPDLDIVTSALNRWYYSEIRDLATDAIREANANGWRTDSEELSEYLHETIDGYGLVIYTYQAQLVTAASDNADAFEEAGCDAASAEVRAYYAIRADIAEEIGRREDELAPPDPSVSNDPP